MKKFLAGIAAVILLANLSDVDAKSKKSDEKIPTAEIEESIHARGERVFPIGRANTTYAKYFTGRSYVAPIAMGEGFSVMNVTFEPKCINNWHIHHGSCQILVGVAGRGYYQIWGQDVVEMQPGDSVIIPEGVKHWHGASDIEWFQHFSIMNEDSTTEWLEPVDPEIYDNLPKG